MRHTFRPADLTDEDSFGEYVILEDDWAWISVKIGSNCCFERHRVYAFHRGPTGWEEAQQIRPSDQTNASLFGWEFDKSGEWLAIGDSQAYDSNQVLVGATYLYREQGGQWIEEQKLLPPTGLVDYQAFGWSVDVEEDLMVIGAPYDNPWSALSGSAYVYRLVGGTWQLEQKLTPNFGLYWDWFGYSVAISDGRIFVGIPHDDGQPGGDYVLYQGSVAVFEQSGGTWAETRRIQGPVTSTTWIEFGRKLKAHDDRLLVLTDSAEIGASFLYDVRDTEEVLTHQFVPSNIQDLMDESGYGFFGQAGDFLGDTVLIAAPRSGDGFDSSKGYIYAYDLGHDAVSYCTAAPNSTGQASELKAIGPIGVAQNELTLKAKFIPTGQTGIVFYGPDQVQVPFGNGVRCVGGFLSRLAPQAEVNGRLTFELDMTAPPTSLGQITGGSTWNFQVWYRDPVAGGSAFNLSNALSIAFCE